MEPSTISALRPYFCCLHKICNHNFSLGFLVFPSKEWLLPLTFTSHSVEEYLIICTVLLTSFSFSCRGTKGFLCDVSMIDASGRRQRAADTNRTFAPCQTEPGSLSEAPGWQKEDRKTRTLSSRSWRINVGG